MIEEVDDGRSWCPAEATHEGQTETSDKCNLPAVLCPHPGTNGLWRQSAMSHRAQGGSLSHIGLHQSKRKPRWLLLKLTQAQIGPELSAPSYCYGYVELLL